jgi:hypothetical protein
MLSIILVVIKSDAANLVVGAPPFRNVHYSSLNIRSGNLGDSLPTPRDEDIGDNLRRTIHDQRGVTPIYRTTSTKQINLEEENILPRNRK